MKELPDFAIDPTERIKPGSRKSTWQKIEPSGGVSEGRAGLPPWVMPILFGVVLWGIVTVISDQINAALYERRAKAVLKEMQAEMKAEMEKAFKQK